MKLKFNSNTESEVSIDGQNTSIKSNNQFIWKDEKASFVIKSTTGVNNPNWGLLYGNFEGIIFPNNKLSQVWVDFHIDHDIAMGTKLYPHIHWMPLTNNIGYVRWGFEYIIAKGHGQSQFPTTSNIIYVNHTVPENSQYRHMTTEVPEVDGILSSEIEPDSVIKMRIFRDGVNDTHGSNVHGWQSDIHYQIGQLGTINRAPNFFGN